MKVLASDEEASAGTVSIPPRARIGVLRQDRFLDDGEIILDLAMRGDAVVWNALTEQRRMVAAGGDVDAGRMADLEDLIAAHAGYTLEARASEVLEGLAIQTRFHRAPLSTLSGGFKLRVLLAQVLVGGVDVLLLDEPTNHLDILTIRWLEKFLAGYAGCAVIISHDQRFLDNVTSHTLDVDYRTITLYKGNYSKAMVEKAGVRERAETGVARAQEEIARKRAFVERFGAKNTKATQAQSRLKQIEKIEVAIAGRKLAAHAALSRRARATERARGAGAARREQGLRRQARADRRVADGAAGRARGHHRTQRPRQARPCCGLRWNAWRRTRDGRSGGTKRNSAISRRITREVLDDAEVTPLQSMEALCPGESPTFVRSQLGRVLFSGEDVDKRVGLLSGGEAARLIFALLAVRKPTRWVPDEPTNHLDLEAIHALVDALKSYAGTVVFVSHDRWFVSELATRVVEITSDGPRDFPGTYAEYLAKLGDDHLDGEAVALKARAVKAEQSPAKEGAAGEGKIDTWEEQKKRRNRASQLPKLRDKVLAEIAAVEARKAEIQAIYADSAFFQRASHDEIDALVKEHDGLGPRIDGLMSEWEEIEREIEAAGANG